MTDTEQAWLAGLLEGEGSFLAGPPSKPHLPRVSLEMTDEDIVARVAQLWGVKYHHLPRRKQGWRDTFKVTLVGKPAVSLMEHLCNLMGSRRREQITRAIATYAIRRKNKLTADTIPCIRQLLATQSISEIARTFGVSRANIRAIRDGKIWKNVGL